MAWGSSQMTEGKLVAEPVQTSVLARLFGDGFKEADADLRAQLDGLQARAAF